MITPRMYQVRYDASLRTVLSNFRFTLWGPAPHHSLKNRIFFWLPAWWASGVSGDHQQDHQCLWLLLCYSFVLSFIACILLGIKLLLLVCINIESSHDDVIKWKHFPRYWPFVRGIHRWPVNSPHKGQWCGALMLSLICVWVNGWVNNREAGDLRRYRVHYDVIVMEWQASVSTLTRFRRWCLARGKSSSSSSGSNNS